MTSASGLELAWCLLAFKAECEKRISGFSDFRQLVTVSPDNLREPTPALLCALQIPFMAGRDRAERLGAATPQRKQLDEALTTTELSDLERLTKTPKSAARKPLGQPQVRLCARLWLSQRLACHRGPYQRSVQRTPVTRPHRSHMQPPAAPPPLPAQPAGTAILLQLQAS